METDLENEKAKMTSEFTELHISLVTFRFRDFIT